MPQETRQFEVIVIGGGHAGVEAAWAAANLLPRGAGERGAPSVALVTLDPSKIGVMSCNPAIGGLAKGQIVREVDALGGVMGLATDLTGIQFKVLNTSKGAAVHGPRAQCDKHAYAETVRRLIASRPEIEVIAGAVEEILVEGGRVRGVLVKGQMAKGQRAKLRGGEVVAGSDFGDLALCHLAISQLTLSAPAVVLTTGTFMRGLMHTGERKTPGGRHGEGAAEGISAALRGLGFELGRLKTGTPPRLKRGTIDWESLEPQRGDDPPAAFSEIMGSRDQGIMGSSPDLIPRSLDPLIPSAFPVLPQVECRITSTTAAAHEVIRANLHRAPMYSGQIESAGPRYCPSIEDKVVRFADRDSHHVFLEPESLRDDWVYCNGVSTSLPADVQDAVVRAMPGCARAEILRYGYAVEYDMVRPHQICATGMTKLVEGLFLAGQINGTSGYEEAAAQGVVAGINAARHAQGRDPVTFGRDAAYIGVLMDDLVTKTPVEPYRMFTSRAEHRLLLRADNAADRLTPLAIELGLLDSTELGQARQRLFAERRRQLAEAARLMRTVRVDGVRVSELSRRPEFGPAQLAAALAKEGPGERGEGGQEGWLRGVLFTAHTDAFYEAYLVRQGAEIKRQAELERRRIPPTIDYHTIPSLRAEAKHALSRFRPETLGQAGRLEGITPADLTLLAVVLKRHGGGGGGGGRGVEAPAGV